MEYYEKLRALREDAEPRLSQSAIASMLGTTQQYYSEYETGKRALPLDHLVKLCLFFGVSSDYVLGLPKNLKRPER